MAKAKKKGKRVCEWGRVTRGKRKGRCRKRRYVRRARAARTVRMSAQPTARMPTGTMKMRSRTATMAPGRVTRPMWR